MTNTTELTDIRKPDLHTREPMEWPRPPAVPRWMVWAPYAAMLFPVGYGCLRAWWTIHGAPSFGHLGFDLFFFSGWSAVGLCAAAAVIALALRLAPWRWPLLGAAWVVCAAHVAACPLLLLDAVGVVLPGMGVQLLPVAAMSRSACLIEGILVGAAAEAYRRRWRSGCLFCGRTKVRVRFARTPQWAWWGAYIAVAGCLARVGAQVAIGFGRIQKLGGARMAFQAAVLETGFLLAGTVLPLALVHSWGRIVPRWIPLLAGRPVPRWLPLGPALVLSPLMTVYFGLTLVKVIADTLSGAWRHSFDPFPLAFFWVAVPAYWVWGLGLGAAAIAYYQRTRPVCGVCGR